MHGNLPALEKLLKLEAKADLYINLGDTVNYGPWSNECVDLINTLPNCINILGNHEEYFLNKNCDVNNEVVKGFFEHNILTFCKDSIIRKYKKQVFYNGYRLIHNLLPKGYVFSDTPIVVDQNSIIGHSHQQYVREVGAYNLINPGSLGQNRQNFNTAQYTIWYPDIAKFEEKEFRVNNMLMIRELERLNYPKNCINYLKGKL